MWGSSGSRCCWSSSGAHGVCAVLGLGLESQVVRAHVIVTGLSIQTENPATAVRRRIGNKDTTAALAWRTGTEISRWSTCSAVGIEPCLTPGLVAPRRQSAFILTQDIHFAIIRVGNEGVLRLTHAQFIQGRRQCGYHAEDQNHCSQG